MVASVTAEPLLSLNALHSVAVPVCNPAWLALNLKRSKAFRLIGYRLWAPFLNCSPVHGSKVLMFFPGFGAGSSIPPATDQKGAACCWYHIATIQPHQPEYF